MDSTKKYKIKERFDEMPYTARTEAIAKACELMEISESHLRKIWGYESDSVHEAKPSQLIVLADLFDCSIDDLINQPIQIAQS